MNRINSSLQSDNFSRFVTWSLGGHFILIVLLTVKAVVFPSEPMEFKSAIRVDLVGLPDKVETPKPKPSPAPKPIAKPEPKPKAEPKPKPVPKAIDKVNLKKAKSEQEKALERLKALEAIEKIEKEQEQKPQQPPQEFKGNIKTAGNSLTGLDRIAFDRYFASLETHIRQRWNLPRWLADSNLRAVAHVTIDDRGYVTDKRIVESSGNQVFDNLVLQTVEQASPLPEPPSRLKSVLALRGFQIRFPD